jgi:hypothetical protein
MIGKIQPTGLAALCVKKFDNCYFVKKSPKVQNKTFGQPKSLQMSYGRYFTALQLVNLVVAL